MNAELIKAAIEVVHNEQILVNVVSRRVRQLTVGHRPMVGDTIGLGYADIALTEISQGKLGFEFRSSDNAAGQAEVVEFPGVITTGNRKKAA